MLGDNPKNLVQLLLDDRMTWTDQMHLRMMCVKEIEALQKRLDLWRSAALMAYHFPIHCEGIGPKNCSQCNDVLQARLEAEAADES